MTDALDERVRRLDAERNSGPVRSRNSFALPPLPDPEDDYGWKRLLERRRAVVLAEKAAS